MPARQFIIIPGTNTEKDFSGCEDREADVPNGIQAHTEPDSEIDAEKEVNLPTNAKKLSCALLKLTGVFNPVLLQVVSQKHDVPHFWAYIRRCAEGKKKSGFSMYQFREAVMEALLELYDKRYDPQIMINGRVVRDALFYWKKQTAGNRHVQRPITDAPPPPEAPDPNANNAQLPVWDAKGDIVLVLEDDDEEDDPLLLTNRSLDQVGNKRGGCMCTISDPYGPREAGNNDIYEFVQFQSKKPEDYAANVNYHPDVRSEEFKNESEHPGKSSCWSVTIVNKQASHLANAWGALKIFFKFCKEYAEHGMYSST